MKELLIELSKESVFEESKIYMEGRVNLKKVLETIDEFDEKANDIYGKIENDDNDLIKAEKEN